VHANAHNREGDGPGWKSPEYSQRVLQHFLHATLVIVGKVSRGIGDADVLTRAV
jgi:hypothetical protein